jgi:hypothetical protein
MKNYQTSQVYSVDVLFNFSFRISPNIIGIHQKTLIVSGKTHEHIIDSLAVFFPKRENFIIISLSWH